MKEDLIRINTRLQPTLGSRLRLYLKSVKESNISRTIRLALDKFLSDEGF